jgi:exosortase A
MSAVLDRPMLKLPLAWHRPLVVLALLLVALFLLYRDTWAGMVGIWMRSDTFAHAFLVPPIALWLAWRRRAHLAGLVPRAQPLWLLPLAAAGAFWLPGEMAGVNALTQLMVTAMLVCAVVAVLGTRVARELTFPLGFLFFMVPIGEFLLPTFMNWTADFTIGALRLSGVPVYREGLNFVIPSGSWSVVEACSGIRYLIASFMVGTLFAYLNFSSQRRRLLFCVVAIVVPVVANWLRAYMIVMLGHLSGNKLAVGVDHLIYGWIFFGLIIVAMFMIGARWSQPPVALPAHAPQPAPSAQRMGLVGLSALAVLALPSALHGAQEQQDRAASNALVLQLPELPGSGTAAAPGLDPVFVNPSATARRSYALPGGSVHVHVAYYRQQAFGRKLVNSENVLVTSNNRQWLRTAGSEALDAEGREWRSTELRNGGAAGSPTRARLDVRQVYWVGGRLTTSDAEAAALGLWHRLLGSGDDAAMITLYTEGDSPRDTAARLDRFTSQHLAAIQASLAAAQAAGRAPPSPRSTTQP